MCNSGVCSDCTRNNDCPSGSLCFASRCEAVCASDKECTASGLLCDLEQRRCVECVVNSDCPSDFHCADGSCLRSVCNASDSRCNSVSGAVELCAPAGDRFISLYCADQQRCVEDNGRGTCVNWLCVPGSTHCSSDAQRIEQCSADGSKTVVQSNCSSEQVCVDAHCQPLVCDAGKAFCKGGDAYLCGANGTSSTLAQECGPNAYCDDDSGACRPNQCSPNQTGCLDNKVFRCNGEGSDYESLTACAAEEACINGACAAVGCEANTRSCEGKSTVRVCNSTGTASSVAEVCDGAHHCVVSGNTAACDDDACIPNAVSCNGDVVTTCKPDGLGYGSDGIDCAASGRVCVNGGCVAKVCQPGALSCVGEATYLCVKAGSALALFQSCPSGTYCDAAAPSCKAQVCSPSSLGCNGNVAATCNANGSGYATTGAVDCSATALFCEAGACAPVTCTPNVQFCKNGDVYKCSVSGTSASLVSDCVDSFQHCSQSGTSAFCVSDACSQNSLSCLGNSLAVCNAEGSTYASVTDCGAQVCLTGQCVTKICTPGNLQCSGTNSTVCNASGTAWVVNQVCNTSVTGTVCGADGACHQAYCSAGLSTCLGDVPGTCNSTGSAEVSSGTSCASSGQVCTISGCASSTSDVLASDAMYLNLYNAPMLLGNIVYTTSARKLTSIKMHLALSSTTVETVRYVVYVADRLAGPYTAQADVVGPPTATVSVSTPLSANKYYFIGAYATPTVWLYGESGSLRYLSFGRVQGSLVSSQFSAGPPTTFSGVAPNFSLAPALTVETTAP